MEKVLISVPDEVAIRMRAMIPGRQRLIEKEVIKRESALYKCALAVEKDKALHREIEEWDVTLQDGLEAVSLQKI